MLIYIATLNGATKDSTTFSSTNSATLIVQCDQMEH